MAGGAGNIRTNPVITRHTATSQSPGQICGDSQLKIGCWYYVIVICFYGTRDGHVQCLVSNLLYTGRSVLVSHKKVEFLKLFVDIFTQYTVIKNACQEMMSTTPLVEHCANLSLISTQIWSGAPAPGLIIKVSS